MLHGCCLRRLFQNADFFPQQNADPQKLSSGLYNCSVDYWRFQQHLDCNLKVECEDGRDEGGHCPYSSPACRGWIASGNKCFRYVGNEVLQKIRGDTKNLYMKVVRYCGSKNASIGAPIHPGDVSKVFHPLYRLNRSRPLIVSVFSGGLSVPSAYRTSIIAHEKTVLHHTSKVYVSESRPYQGEKMCYALVEQGLIAKMCKQTDYTKSAFAATCETMSQGGVDNRSDSAIISFPNVSSEVTRLRASLTRCSNGQVTHTFLPCSGNSLSLASFKCRDEVTRVHYTLVCDFRQDCHDGSDESFCRHPPCDGFTCTSGQCVSYTKRCNIVSDCIDDSDEKDCAEYFEYKGKPQLLDSPVLVSFDGKSSFIMESMGSTETCPDTHYRCPGEYNDCLPVFTRCNGWYDCIDHADENDCEEITCPGFYRCFNSTVCVHLDHLCDSWPHCPQHDDEWLCDMTCPKRCICQGHAFVCSKPFSVYRFPQLRYLDAEGSGLTLSDLNNNKYIVHLILRWCSLTVVSTSELVNLQILDLSANKLQTINVEVFVTLAKLRTLSLAENPLSTLIRPSSSVQQTALRTIDLSYTNLSAIDCQNLSNFYYLQNLNLSFTALNTLQSYSFQCTPRLVKLDFKGSHVTNFPANVFKALFHLRVIITDNYKLCCEQILPVQSELMTCDAPKDEISSCEDLLQSGLYRVFLWLISILSLLGNVFCLVMRVCVQRGVSVSGFHVLVSNLSMADLLMGVYITIIGVADELFRGKYLHYDETWTHSVACKVAGFLSLLSSEVSALTIWLITLDRFIVLRFPFSRARFQKTSALAVCLGAWIIGFLLALMPLLPVTSHWEFYSQTGICIPLPVTRQNFKGRMYSVSVFMVLNFVLFLFIATGQAFIYGSIQKNALKSNTTNVARDLTIARRLLSVAVTDFLCWFPIGLCGLLASANTPISGEVNVALAIFVLPLNSALNPFMYTFNTVMEKRRKLKEAMLLRWLKTHSDLLNRL